MTDFDINDRFGKKLRICVKNTDLGKKLQIFKAENFTDSLSQNVLTEIISNNYCY